VPAGFCAALSERRTCAEWAAAGDFLIEMVHDKRVSADVHPIGEQGTEAVVVELRQIVEKGIKPAYRRIAGDGAFGKGWKAGIAP
jgi:hypothetical protein